ncbi:MAG TPA: hypothetical protein VFV16_02910 [Candidatus Nitrosotalea sp.]|nr:hypothetical protein [Candidatus Nitrosotalea sp.]
MQKKVLATIVAIAIIVTIGLSFGPIQNIPSAFAVGKPSYKAVTTDIPTEEWFSFKGITLQPGEFLDMVDTTSFLTTKGHVAMYVPCDASGHPKISFLQGIVDVGVNTLTPVDPEYLSQLSTPGQNCLYHFDIGTPQGVTDFAIVNTSHDPITFGDRNTSTFSVAEGLKKLSG